jgi:hypothetical protein
LGEGLELELVLELELELVELVLEQVVALVLEVPG